MRWSRAAVFAAVAEVAVPLAIVLVFVVLRDSPPDWGCGIPEPRGQQARLDDFRAGAIPIHLAGAAILAAAIAGLSRERVLAAGRSQPVGRTTAIALAAAALYTAVSLADHDVFVPLLVAGLVTVGAVAYAVSGHELPRVLAIAVPVAGVAAWLVTRPRARGYLLAAFAWAELVLGLPGSLGMIYLDGRGGLIC